MQFVDVPKRTVTFEDGRVATVPAFRISEYCVTVREFLEFEEATGYTTQAERKGGKGFRINELIEHIPEESRPGAEAFCLSFIDATRYCQWANVRLPSEAEWLAAIVVDDRVYDRKDRKSFPFYGPNGAYDMEKLKGLPKGGGCEFTSTLTPAGLVVARSGPRYFRESDWREYASDHRRLVRPNEWDLFTSFRVVAIDRTTE